MMNLDEAIKHCEEVMMENLEKTKDRNASDPIAKNCFECADEHRQLAEWLKELKAYREKLNCTDCIIDGTDACSRGAGRAVDDEICGDFIPSRSEIPNTCGDAISRRAVLNLMRGLTRWCVKSEDGKWKNVGLLYDDVMFGIDKLPFVTPQQRTGCYIVAEVLDKIRAEIAELEEGISSYHNDRPWVFKDEVLQIIDKYKMESEGKE